MKHAILILAHGNFNYLCALIDYFDEDFYIYIHLDKKWVLSDAQLQELSQKKNVVCVYQTYKINWGGYNVLAATLLLMQRAIKDGLADYYHAISGQDAPVVSIEEFKLFFERYKGREFMEYKTYPRKDWDNGTYDRITSFHFLDYLNYRNRRGRKMIAVTDTLQKKFGIHRKLPEQFPDLYGGSAWFSLSKVAIRYIIEYTQTHPAFLNRLKHTFAPDEIYLLTVLLNSPLKATIENRNLRYIVWEPRNFSFPAVLDIRDYYPILKSGALFARKIAFPVSQPLLNRLEKTSFFRAKVADST